MAKATQPDVAPHVGADEAESLSPQSSVLITSPGKHITIAALGIFLAALDQTVIVTALWPISTDLQIPVTELDRAAWVVTAYLLGYTVALPLMGRVADVYGQRRIYLVSLGIFMLGSILCALAPSLEFLIAARALQAIGGGAVLPVGMAMVRHLFREHRVPFMLGVLGAVAEAGGVIGPLWGALVMTGFDGWFGVIGWRWIFWVNVPLCLLFAFLIFRTPPLPRYPGKVDWAGAGLLGMALLALSLGLSTSGTVGAWAGLDPQTTAGASGELITPQSLTLFGLSLVLFVAFVLWQRRASTPLIPLELFSRRTWPFSAANITNFMVGAALIITMVNVPLYVASVLDGTAEQGGFMLLRMTALIPVGAIAGGLLGVRVQFRWVAVLGLIVTALGFWEMSAWSLAAPDAPLNWLGLALNGLGFGLLISPVTATALQWGGLKRAALSAASVNVSRMIGMMVSLSVLTVLGLHRFQELMSAHPAPIVPFRDETAEQFAQRTADYTVAYKSASLEVYTTGFLIALLVCVAGIAFALWLRRNPESEVETGPRF
ncbi:MAG TPA: MFS transporter [Chloroflexia bacterium]|nr:MFS transporter [Chloroflexia bacterium]